MAAEARGALTNGDGADVAERTHAWRDARDAKRDQLAAEAAHAAEYGHGSVHADAVPSQRAADASTRLYMDASRLRSVKEELAEALAASDAAELAPSAPAATTEAQEASTERLYRRGVEAVQRRNQAPGNAGPTLARNRSASLDRGMSRGRLVGPTTPLSPRSARAADLQQLEAMYRRAEQIERKKEEQRTRAAEEARERAHPRLNRRSMSLAETMSPEKWERFHSKSLSMRRLLPATEEEADAAKGAGQTDGSPRRDVEDAEATFQPQLRRRSIVLAAKRNPPNVAATERLYRDAMALAEKRAAWTAKAPDYELRGCTFYPDVNAAAAAAMPIGKGTVASASAGTPARQRSPASTGASQRAPFRVHVYHPIRQSEPPTPASTASAPVHRRPALRAISPEAGQQVYDRHRAWLTEREKRLQVARQQAQAEELRPCTFAPQRPVPVDHAERPPQYASTGRRSLSPARRSAGAANAQAQQPGASSSKRPRAASISGSRTPSSPPKGIQEFVSRQARARALAFERQNPPFADGTKWTGRTTQFQEFVFRGDGNHREILYTEGGYASKALRKPVSAATSGLPLHGVTMDASPTSAGYVDVGDDGDALDAGAAFSGAAPEVATVDDIRARLRQLEAMSSPPARQQPPRRAAPPPPYSGEASPAVTAPGLNRNPTFDAYFSGLPAGALVPAAPPPPPPGISAPPSASAMSNLLSRMDAMAAAASLR